ncbi:MAG: cytochrome c oxidase subunit II [Alphaproteobacteria bacterium]|nr:cytochrome c oxidase subunit II [Alphaproteobacteria bacterium]
MYMRILAFLVALGIAPAALAAQPEAWRIGMQDPANALAEQTNSFHTTVTILSVAIAIFVMVLLAYTMWKFAASRNPNPSTVTHNTMIEVLWTVIPVAILVVITIPSINLLYAFDKTQDAELTIKAIGHQWYWSYEYPDNGNFTFDAYMAGQGGAPLEKGQVRLLSTDNPVVLPVDTRVRVLVTATDVIHSWAVPAFFNKIDGSPGRTNQLLIDRVKKTGTYYGQCSELCGQAHSFMPIEVKIVSKADFAAWVQKQQPRKVGDARPQDTPADLADAQPARPATKE